MGHSFNKCIVAIDAGLRLGLNIGIFNRHSKDIIRQLFVV